MRSLVFLAVFVAACDGGSGDDTAGDDSGPVDSGETADSADSADSGDTDTADSGDTDTADSGDTDSADSGDTDTADSGDSADSGDTDTADSGDSGDTGDTGTPPSFLSGIVFGATFNGSLGDSGPLALPVASGGQNATFVADRNGQPNAALSSTSCLQYGPVEFGGGSGEFSVAFWLKPGATFLGGARQTAGGAGGGAFQTYYSGGSWTTEVYDTSSGSRQVSFGSAAVTLTEGTWTHVAFTTKAGGTWVLYVDGVAQTVSGSPPPGLQLATGNHLVGCGGDAGFDADLDAYMLWNRQLTATEVAELVAFDEL